MASTRLDVFYDLANSVDIDVRDSLADELAGTDCVGSGADFIRGAGFGTRDRQYVFNNEVELNAAKERLQDAGFRFVE